VYVNKGLGIGTMKKIHGGRVNRGNRPHHNGSSSGSVARKAIQALEKMRIIEKDPKGFVAC
jgi:small subunit ribosomal protein S19e